MRGLVVLASTLICCAVALTAPPGSPRSIEYNRDVRPILAENCFACHGPDSAARKGDLRLDNRETALKAEAFVPGKPDESALIERISSMDPDAVMPPRSTHKSLSTAQKDTLRSWIAGGAAYQPHWSFIPPVRPTPPAGSGWCRNPIDQFIEAECSKAGLKPNAEADRRTLARRLSLDLIGLPPEPAEVEEFVCDRSPDWYERYVDKLMRSPHWGEHRGRYWLDAARYADTHGIHFDNYREMWSYRDWVIRAFNDNMPFDKFSIEQLAGDLLPQPTLEQRIATGFNRCNITTNEGGAIDDEYLVLYTRDRTETTSLVWLGLTTGCAVCHDHKLDPLSQREFYELAAFFNNTTQRAMDGNIHNTPPIVPVAKKEDRARLAEIQRETASVVRLIAERRKSARPDFDRWQSETTSEKVAAMLPGDRLLAELPLAEGKGQSTLVKTGLQSKQVELTPGYEWSPSKDKRAGLHIKPGPALQLSDVGDFDTREPFSISVWLRNGRKNQNGAALARMDVPGGFRGWDLWIQNDRVGCHIIHNWPDDALKVVTRKPLPFDTWVHVTVVYDGSASAKGLRIFYNGEAQQVDIEADRLKTASRSPVPLSVGQRHATDRVKGLHLNDARFYGRALSAGEVMQLASSSRAVEILSRPKSDRSPAERDELFAWWLATIDAPYRALDTKADSLKREESAILGRGTVAHVMNEMAKPPIAHLLHRGEYDQRREAVGPNTPRVLPAFMPELPRNRLGLAQWLFRPDHPLTARVTVNRFWQEMFGQGLVRTSGDFGIAGELPSHPELLDWLALEFRDSGWDVKKFVRLIVCSSTYRQSAVTTTEKREKDPSNRLLSRGPRFRMDAEMVRDAALASSGLLVRTVGGPSVKPYQPEGVWEAVAMIGSNTRDYKQDRGENLYRRSMYTFWKRAAPPASMEILNAPNRETCAVRRERTNTPLQALVTLNDPQFVEAARRLAENALHEDVSDAATIDWIAIRVLARPLSPEERKITLVSLGRLTDYYQAHPDEAVRLLTVGESPRDTRLNPVQHAAWTMLCNELLNLDEAICK
ncbi:MAG: DUF1553 domain-containing protein [Gemmataceae bacterium]|nr:DUF1553 domain-containing protein [Gemmataceae bacterium]